METTANAEYSKPRYAIGTQFTSRGKSPRLCTVVDIYTTINHAGEVVKVLYVATHEFMGQTITDREVPEVTISMGLVKAAA